MNQPPDTPLTITLPFSDFIALLFGADDLTDIPIASRSVGDTAKIIKVPIPYGKLMESIQGKQPDGMLPYVHVEFYPTHAEVWQYPDWIESNTRRNRIRAASIASREESVRNSERIPELVDALREAYPARNEFLTTFAYALLKHSNHKEYEKIIAALNISELLEKYSKEDKGNV